MIEFENSLYAYLGLALSTLLSGALIFLRHRLHTRISIFSCLLYGVLIALSAALLAGPYKVSSQSTGRLLLLLDVSDSMDSEQANQLLDRAREFERSGLSVDILPFAGDTASIPAPLSQVSYASLRQSWQRLGVGQTNIEKAFQTLLKRDEPGALLISDGRETEASSKETLERIGNAGLKIYPISPDEDFSGSSFQISQLNAPLLAAPQSKVDLRISLQNSSKESQTGTLLVTQAGREIYRKELTLEAQKEQLVIVKSEVLEGGVQELVATLMPQDAGFLRSSRSSYVATREREKVLLLGGAPEDNKFLTRVLEQQKYQVESRIADKQISIDKIDSYSLIVFNNISIRQIDSRLPAQLKSFVAGGGRFLMIGGERSFGLGGYKDTAIEEILPVSMVPPQTVKKRLNVAVELVLDKSRSMLSGSKIEYAKEAATEVIRNLKDEDFIGVIGFDTTPFIAIPIMQVGQGRAFAIERVNTLFPTGKTNLFPAIDEGRRSLVKVPAGRKHMIVLTDGRIPDAGPYYIDLVKGMRQAGITVSTVMMGGEADTRLLRDMAEIGGGSFYQTSSAQNLPRIFLSDIKVSTGEKTLKESSEYLVRLNRESEVFFSESSFPPVQGYVETRPKNGAELNLLTSALGRVEPLFAWWDYKKGRSAAFTSDVSGRWSKYWIPWPKFQKFWTEVIDGLRPRQTAENEQDVRFEARYFLEGGSLVLDVAVFDDPGGSRLTGVLTLPDGSTQNTSFEGIAPGRYQFKSIKANAGKHLLSMNLGERKLTPIAFHLSGELFGEVQGKGFDLPALATIAEVSGGKLNPDPQSFISEAEQRTIKQPFNEPILWLILLGLLLEIFNREFGFRALSKILIMKLHRSLR